MRRNTEPFENKRVIESALSDYSGIGTLCLQAVDTLDNIIAQLCLPRVDFKRWISKGWNFKHWREPKHTKEWEKLAVASFLPGYERV